MDRIIIKICNNHMALFLFFFSFFTQKEKKKKEGSKKKSIGTTKTNHIYLCLL